MSDSITGEGVKFVLSGITYVVEKVVEERGDHLVIDALQGGKTRCRILVSRELVFPGQASQPPASKDPLVEAGSGSGRGYTG